MEQTKEDLETGNVRPREEEVEETEELDIFNDYL